MIRRILAGAALAAAATAPSAQAAPPYCAAVTAGGQSYASACAISPSCAVSGGALGHTSLGFVFCIDWP